MSVVHKNSDSVIIDTRFVSEWKKYTFLLELYIDDHLE